MTHSTPDTCCDNMHQGLVQLKWWETTSTLREGMNEKSITILSDLLEKLLCFIYNFKEIECPCDVSFTIYFQY